MSWFHKIDFIPAQPEDANENERAEKKPVNEHTQTHKQMQWRTIRAWGHVPIFAGVLYFHIIL